MAYVLSKSGGFSGLGELGELFGINVSVPTPLGWQGGLRIGFVF